VGFLRVIYDKSIEGFVGGKFRGEWWERFGAWRSGGFRSPQSFGDQYTTKVDAR